LNLTEHLDEPVKSLKMAQIWTSPRKVLVFTVSIVEFREYVKTYTKQ